MRIVAECARDALPLRLYMRFYDVQRQEIPLRGRKGFISSCHLTIFRISQKQNIIMIRQRRRKYCSDHNHNYLCKFV